MRLQVHSFFLPKKASKFFGRKNTIFAKGLLPHLCGYKVTLFFRAPQMGVYKVKWSFFSAANAAAKGHTIFKITRKRVIIRSSPGFVSDLITTPPALSGFIDHVEQSVKNLTVIFY